MNEKYIDIRNEITENDRLNIPIKEKYIILKQLLDRQCKEITRDEPLQFSSLFARLVFIAQKYDLPQSLEWQLQNIRIKNAFLLKDERNNISEKQYIKAKNCISQFLGVVYEEVFLTDTLIEDIYSENLKPLIFQRIRVQVLNIDTQNEFIICHADTDDFESKLTVKYNIESVNDAFNQTIEQLWIGAQLNLINCKRNKDGYYIPQFIILEPDFLIDASSLAECFQNYGKSHLHYFRKKFEPVPNSHYILMGNLANSFLDELIYAPTPQDVNFEKAFLHAFKQMPFEFTSCNDIRDAADFRTFMTKARTHFENIKRVVIHDFPNNKIDIRHCSLEPSFCCEKFGLQGRLDLLQLAKDESDLDRIIELKSGGLPYPKDEPSKIAINHETQAAIYRLIVESVFNRDSRKTQVAILYSSAENEGENIRFSPTYKTHEKEILNIRNLIVSVENKLYKGDYETVKEVFEQTFNLDSYNKAPAFFIDRLNKLEQTIKKTSILEQRYVYCFISFITREIYLQKTGDGRFESHTGTSYLWNTTYQERLETYDLISNLRIVEIDDLGNDMKIRFERDDKKNFINFREGDICILYPRETNDDTVLSNQILKGTIAEISINEVLVRFRYKQRNKDYFEKYSSWTIEHDKLDHAYNAMYKGLFSFLRAPVAKRELLLGISAPRSTYVPTDSSLNLSSTSKQEVIIQKAMAAKDYFLIVGPPGTGKTSIFARRLIELLYADSSKNILIIAYTNRAVDELCEAINAAFKCLEGSCDQYIRIGTELSCDPIYRHRLLQVISRTVKTRNDLRQIMLNQRIYIGTLASVIGKLDLFEMKKFDIAIIDEASQILEPQLIGLLPLFEKFILIGDHKQLSTITLQGDSKAIIDDLHLNHIGLFDCRESFFERIFLQCQTHKWESAYDVLTYQGRMHEVIASFPNRHFYDGKLLLANNWQNEPLVYNVILNSTIYTQLVTQHRLAFIANKSNSTNPLSDKMNESEADIVVAFATAIWTVYEANDLSFKPRNTLGIITPYRNQIALIKHKLEETGIASLQEITVDTVERFQGSQRDIILLSFCVNKSYQLEHLSNTNRDGTVDRKLNVALTRARKQLFMVGNESIYSKISFIRIYLSLSR